MNSVWMDEFNNNFLGRRKAIVLHGSRERRLKLLAQKADFYIINHDGLKVIAEGVTSEAEFAALIEVGFDGATGPGIKEPA